MSLRWLAAASTVVALAGCAPGARIEGVRVDPGLGVATPSGGFAQTFTPRQAVLAAADAAPRPVPGRFAFVVKAVGRQDGWLYLNSEDDYRDQRNLTVAIHPRLIATIEQRFGGPAERTLIGRAIITRGSARKVRIDLIHNGRPTGKYYFQTHVDVLEADQLQPAQPD